MSFEPVDIFVMDQAHEKLEGVVARVFNQDGSRVYSQHTTDAEGKVSLLLPSGATYQVRMYKFGVSFEPALLEVKEQVKNAFNVHGDVFEWPQATDSRLCAASGFFRDITGAPRANQDFHFVADFNPFVLDGAGVATDRQSVRSNKDGWVTISLVRNAIYGVTMEGWQDQFRRVIVPDRPSVNLAHLLFPRVDRVVRGGGEDDVSVHVGCTVTVPLTVLTTDFRELDSISSRLIWSSSDRNVFVISSREKGNLVLRGVGRGQANLCARRTPSMQGGEPPVYYPDTPVRGVPIQVSVT